MLTRKSDIDYLEKMIDHVGFGLTASELAQCFNKAFLVATPFQRLGVKKAIAVYLSTMKTLHTRIVESENNKSVGAFGHWLLANDYWPLPVVGAKG